MAHKVYRLAFTDEAGEITDSTFYVGVTQNLKMRYYQHTKDEIVYNKTSTIIKFFHNQIRPIYIICLAEFDDRKEAEEHEGSLIVKYSKSHKLINVRGSLLLSSDMRPHISEDRRKKQVEIMYEKVKCFT